MAFCLKAFYHEMRHLNTHALIMKDDKSNVPAQLPSQDHFHFFRAKGFPPTSGPRCTPNSSANHSVGNLDHKRDVARQEISRLVQDLDSATS